jgi:hypothetical protein
MPDAPLDRLVHGEFARPEVSSDALLVALPAPNRATGRRRNPH